MRVEAEPALATTMRPNVSPRDMTATNNSCAADSPGTSDGTCTAVRIAKNGKFRFGRLQLNNAYGSEKLPLSVPIQSRYWSGGHFVNNNLDNCTAINVPAARTLAANAKPDGLPKLYFYRQERVAQCRCSAHGANHGWCCYWSAWRRPSQAAICSAPKERLVRPYFGGARLYELQLG